MTEKKEILYFVIFILGVFVLFLILNFVSAAVVIVAPANFTNNSGRISLNVSFLNDSTDVTSPANANTTWYYNNVAITVYNFACFSGSCNATWNTSDVTDTSSAVFAIILGNDTQTNASRANSSTVLVDNTPPIVFNGNFSNPTTETNYSGNNLLLNISVADVTSGIRAVVFNITNSTSGQNVTFTASRAGSSVSYTTFLNTTGFTDGVYNVTSFVNDTTRGGNLNSSAKIQLIRFDNTPPMVFNGNITAPLSGTNQTGSIVLNVTVIDVTSGIRAITINITNSTSDQNATIIATRQGTTNYFNASINTLSFLDGIYNLTIFANDTTNGGNLNNSARVSIIRFDNTAPSVTVSCTPSPVTAGNKITCTCARSDATSGVNTVAFTENPSTASTGTFTTSCTVTDFAGNSASGSTTYRVEGGGGGAGSGGGGSGASGEVTRWKATYSVTEEDFREGETRELREEQRLRVDINNEDHFVGVVDVTENSAIIEVASTPKRITLNVGETSKFEVTEDNYYDVSVKLNSVSGNRASITILSIHEEVPTLPPEPAQEEISGEEVQEEIVSAPPLEEVKPASYAWLSILIILIIIVVVIVVWFVMKNKRK